MKRPLTPFQEREAQKMRECKIPYTSIAKNLGVTIRALRDFFNSKDKTHG